MEPYSVDDLKKKYRQFLQKTETAVIANPVAYEEIKKILIRVTHSQVDIDDYGPIVTRLTELMEKMGPDTLFCNYYYDNIHPGKSGCARYLRFVCKDLLMQLNEFNDWRIRNRYLEVIK